MTPYHLISTAIAAFSFLGMSTAFAQQSIEPSVSGFSKVSTTGNVELCIQKGEKETLRIEYENINPDNIIAEVKNGELIIKLKKNEYKSKGKLKAYLTYTSLKEIEGNGSSKITAKDVIEGEELEVEIAGSGSFDGEVNVKKLEIDISGSGNITLRGKTGEEKIEISGSGDIDALHLYAQTAQVEISGSGEVKINVEQSISAETSGSGDIKYKGNAQKVHFNASGSGKIRKIEG